MSSVPQNLRYTKEHEWCLVEGDVATVGITQHAAEQLGDIVFVELPKAGAALTQGGTFGVVESVKAVSDLYSPLTGEVVEINGPLQDSPSTINDQPYRGGWLVKIRVQNRAELDGLLDAAAYEALIAG